MLIFLAKPTSFLHLLEVFRDIATLWNMYIFIYVYTHLVDHFPRSSEYMSIGDTRPR